MTEQSLGASPAVQVSGTLAIGGLAMPKKLVLVDYENVQRIDLSILDES